LVSGVLLSTKLHIPAVGPDPVGRPQLTAALDQSLSVALTLVAAPAGFGKSTLVTTWLAAQLARDWG
jgi:LuxR family maltose regulon positive regulatory protein